MHGQKQIEIAHLNPQNYSYKRICMYIYLAWSNDYVRLHRDAEFVDMPVTVWHTVSTAQSYIQFSQSNGIFLYCYQSEQCNGWKTKHFGLLVLCKHFNYLKRTFRLNYTMHCCKWLIQFLKVQFYLSLLIFGTCAPTNHCAWNFLPRTETISFANNKEPEKRWKWSTNQSTIQHGIL